MTADHPVEPEVPERSKTPVFDGWPVTTMARSCVAAIGRMATRGATATDARQGEMIVQLVGDLDALADRRRR